MLVRFSLATIALLCLTFQAFGQAAAPKTTDNWRRAGTSHGVTPRATVTPRALAPTPRPASGAPHVANATARPSVTPVNPTTARVKSGTSALPNGYGQVWREYDITPYTRRVTDTKRPEQAIVDWILRETGYEAWHGEPLGILSATSSAVRVYHTPEMQQTVADIIDRFVQSKAETQTYSLRVITLDNPNWRVKGQKLMQPVTVQTPGIGAWILQKENMALMLNELQRRTDYREHNSASMLVNNGESTIISAQKARPYIRDVAPTPAAFPGFEGRKGHVDEGFLLDFSPLLSADRRVIDAVIKCNIDQIEKMIAVPLDMPVMSGARERAVVEVPQISQFRFQERFRWPADKVLLVSMGMVALPVPVDPKAKQLVPGISLPGPKSAPRADLLIFVEARGQSTGQTPTISKRRPEFEAKRYHGRY